MAGTRRGGVGAFPFFSPWGRVSLVRPERAEAGLDE